MNEKIKEIMKECYVPLVERLDDNVYDMEKFAELIIQECIDVVLDSDTSPKMIVHEPYRTIMNNIVEHFGIE